MADVNKILKDVSNNGKICLGAKETRQMITKGSARLVVLACNSPYMEEINRLASEKGIPVYNYPYNGVELGYACGKNYAVSTLCILDDGGVDLRELIRKGRKNA